jgi:hypothetical protein
MRRRTARSAAAVLVLLATAACELPGEGDPEPGLTLDATRPEFHGALPMRAVAALVLLGMESCTPTDTVVCDAADRAGYRPIDEPTDVTVTDATMALDRHDQFWEVTLTVDPPATPAGLGREAKRVGGWVLLLDGGRAQVAVPAEDATRGTVLVRRLDKAAAYELVERLRTRD